jgi:hypothetical protein
MFLVGSGRLGPDPDPSLKKLPYLNFFSMCKSQKYFRNLCLTFWIMNIQYFLEHIFIKKNSQKKLAQNLCRSGPGSGRFQKSDPDPVKNCPDPQHCLQYYRYLASQFVEKRTVAVCDIFTNYICQIWALEPSKLEPHHVMAPAPSKRCGSGSTTLL